MGSFGKVNMKRNSQAANVRIINNESNYPLSRSEVNTNVLTFLTD